jgi:hypothetical protein
VDNTAVLIKKFNRGLHIDSRLPKGISVLNPYRNSSDVLTWSDAFYERFYSDTKKRRMILGINPGRLGAGQTGIPFTDTKRLYERFGLGSSENQVHETSSAYIYRMIDAFGGAELFYSRFLVSSICPLGFVAQNNGKYLNYNYYDSEQLQKAVTPFIVRCMEEQLLWPIERDVVYCLGTGKNLKFLTKLNSTYGWFGRIVSLEHPRYIMQYKLGQIDAYIAKYLIEFGTS